MNEKTKIGLEVATVAAGLFTVSLLANRSAINIFNPDPAKKRMGVVYALSGIAVSSFVVTQLYYKERKKI